MTAGMVVTKTQTHLKIVSIVTNRFTGGGTKNRTVTAVPVGGLSGSIPETALLAQWGRAFYM